MTETLYQLVFDLNYYIITNSRRKATTRSKSFTDTRDQIDKRIYAQAPAIHSLGDNKLKETWFKMGDMLGEASRYINEVVRLKFVERKPAEALEYEQKMNTLRIQYLEVCGEFYNQLDLIRMEAQRI